jgi:KDO2-lipid IV(A) lauroyltransferase
MFFHWPRERWFALLRVTGGELIERAQAEGRGALILVPHYGNWECMALYLGAHSATALYDPPRIASLEKPLREARERSGMTMLPIDRRGLRAIYEALADGGVTGLLPDQVPARSAGVYAPFFGHPALTMTFAHRLIQRTNPVVLLGAARRVEGGFSVEFAAVDEAIYADDPETSAAAMNRAIEALVRSDPSQYQWEYKRFRRQPHGTTDVYLQDRGR